MKLAVFADGTWNKMDARDKGTNVVKLCNAAVNKEASGQITFYDSGVGTKWYNRLRGGAFGVGISENITDCYRFIVEKWKDENDEIFLFGFSRGAYTVRSLAGLIGFVGLVRDASAIDQAYAFYRDAKKINPKTPGEQKKFDPKRKAEFDRFFQAQVRARPVRIRMVGVWDTVGALGIPQSWLNEHLNPFPHEFHDQSLGAHIEHAYHAVSIDEKRKAFRPTLWEADPRATQIYFAGVHSDVGGGYQDDPELGSITLRWMAEHAKNRGLLLDWSKLPELTGHEHCGNQHESWTSAWRVVRRFDREVEDGATIHRSVRLRLDDTTKKFKPHPYAPVRLTPPWERFKWHPEQ